METLFIPSEKDFRKWIKEAFNECMQSSITKGNILDEHEEELLNRNEVAKKLRISLPTLTDWVKRGLPSHKQRGRVYFIHSEVMEYIRKNRLRNYLKSA